MVTRRTVLKSGLVVGGLTVGGIGVSSSVGADDHALSDDALVVNEFDSVGYPGENELGEWSEHVAFEDDAVEDGVLRLEYDDGGFLASNVFDDVSDYTHLALVVRGDDGGEEADVELEIGDVRGMLSELSTDAIGTEFDTVLVDLEDAGVDASSVDDVKLNFWQHESGAIELDAIGFVDEDDDGRPGSDPSEIQPETTFDEFYTDEHRAAYEYSEWDQPIRGWTEYLPGDAGDGHGGYDQINWHDSEKIEAFEVDVDAVQAKHNSGEPLTFAQMGTQALGWVRQFEEHGFPRHASAKLLSRLSILPNETETPTYHNPPEAVLASSGDRQPATNDPDTLIQDPWPPCARSYQRPGWDYRDRAHDQQEHEEDPDHMWHNPDAEWTTYDNLPEEIYHDDGNPIHDVADNVHPVTGEDLGGDGFTANAPMALEAKIHQENDNYWYQVMEFENTSPVPYHVDAAVFMWIGPSGANGNLRDGHYNNEHRLSPGHGHPQRDVIEVVYDEERHLSAYAVRLAFHDEPYSKRTAYPDQLFSLEVGMSDADAHFETQEELDELVEIMRDTCHVEIETDMDRNVDLMDELGLRNRMTN